MSTSDVGIFYPTLGFISIFTGSFLFPEQWCVTSLKTQKTNKKGIQIIIVRVMVRC